MTSNKALPDDIDKFFEGQSVFFQPPAQEQRVTPPSAPEPRQSPTPSVHEEEIPEPNPPSKQDVMTDVTHDVMTSQIPEVNLKQWQEIIEDTETQNSALRLTSEERYAVEDVVNELRRKHGIKTSMNEIARLGLLLLIDDFKQHKKNSIIHQVKKA